MAIHRVNFLSILVFVLVGILLLVAVPIHGDVQDQRPDDESNSVKSSKPKGANRKKIKKTSDLPRHRIKKVQSKGKPDTKETLESIVTTHDNPSDASNIEELAPKTTRKLQKDKNIKNARPRDFRGQGVGRGAERQGGRGGAGETGDMGFLTQQRDVPMMDWSWGTVWMDDGLNSRGNANADDSDQRQPPAAATGAGIGEGRVAGRFGGSRGRGAGDADDESETGTGNVDARGTGRVVGGRGNTGSNNPFAGEEEWRNQFVSRITPRPTRRPSPPPPTLPAPTPKPLTNPGTPNPTPIPTPAPHPNEQTKCHLCPGGQAAAFMTRALIGTTVKCQDIANTLATATTEDCPMQKEMLPVDIEAYCGCPGKSSVGSCRFCPTGKENIWHNISIPALNHWTCQDVEDYCGFITNPDACTEMSPIADLCCGTWEEYWAEGDDDYYDDAV